MKARPAHRAGAIAAAAILAAAAGCYDARLAPAPLPQGAELFGALPIYRDWWAQTERCAGRTASLGRVTWFVVPGVDEFAINGRRMHAAWIEHYHFIVVAEAGLTDSLLVRHEMLHEILDRVDHPAEYFRVRCAGVTSPE